MDDSQVKKLKEDLEKLQQEEKTLQDAIPPGEASKKILEYCNSTGDPFLGDNETPNTWLANVQSGGGCVIL